MQRTPAIAWQTMRAVGVATARGMVAVGLGWAVAWGSGFLDPTFDAGRGAHGVIGKLALLPDGRVLAAGGFTAFDGHSRTGLVRLERDGRVDVSFDARLETAVRTLALAPDGGILVYPDRDGLLGRLGPEGAPDPGFVRGAGSVDAVWVRSDGFILAAGQVTPPGAEAPRSLCLLRPNGEAVPDFGPLPAVPRVNWLSGATFLGDGGIVVCGMLQDAQFRIRPCFRLNARGQRDPRFRIDVLEGTGAAVVGLADGRILLAGGIQIGTDYVSLVRLGPDGRLDPTFTPFACQGVSDLQLDAAGRIVLAAATFQSPRFGVEESLDWTDGVVRLHSDGTRDWSWNVFLGNAPTGGFHGGYSGYPYVASVAVQPDGKVLAAGLFSHVGDVERPDIARLQARPTALPAFFVAGRRSASEDSAGVEVRIHRVGPTNRQDRIELRTQDDSAVAGVDYVKLREPLTFDVGESVRPMLLPLVQNTNVTAGVMKRFRAELVCTEPACTLGFPSAAWVYIEDDDSVIGFTAPEYRVDELAGGLDLLVHRAGPVFFPGEIEVAYEVVSETAAPAADFVAVSGKLRFAGFFTPHTPSPDTLPVTAAILDDVLVEGDETLRVVLTGVRVPSYLKGTFHLGGVTTARAVIRDDDQPGRPGRGADAAVFWAVEEPAGRVLIAGAFARVNGVPRPNLARLNPDLSLDEGFDAGGGPAVGIWRLSSLLPLADGRLLAAGNFDAFGSVTRSCVARLNSDGSVDPGFNAGLIEPSGGYSHANIRQLASLADGRLLAAGAFKRVGGLEVLALATLFPDGSPDARFRPVLPPSTIEAFSAVLLPDDKVAALLHGVSGGLLVRLLADGQPDPEFNQGQPLAFSGATDHWGLYLRPANRLLVQQQSSLVQFDEWGRGEWEWKTPLEDIHQSLVLPQEQLLVFGRPRGSSGLEQRLYRYLPDGSIDPSFRPDVQGEVYSVSRLSDGRLLLTGHQLVVNGVVRYGFVALRPGGSIDGGVLLTSRRDASGSVLGVYSEDTVPVPVVIQASPDLAVWQAVHTNPPAARLDWSVADWERYPHRFFRVAPQP